MDILVRQNAVDRTEAKPAPESTANQTDSGCETSTTKSIEETLTTTTIISTETRAQNNDLLILRGYPNTNRKFIDKTAYAKLHRSLSPTRQLDSIKAKYESSENEAEVTRSDNDTPRLHRTPPVKLTKQELEVVRNKSKLPVAKPRTSVKSEIILPTQRAAEKPKHRHSLILDRKSKKKDENSNEVFRKNSSSSGEFITIIPRSESVETIDFLHKELDLFTMDKKPKEKKRGSSFRKIFTGRIFSKEKKKKEETESIQQRKNVNCDNIQNENNAFSRQSPYRHSLGSTNIPKPTTRIPQIEERRIPPTNVNTQEIEKKYAQMHVKEFNNIKQNFENPDSPVEHDKPIPTVNPGPMDFKKVASINKFIDTSSSASTMESDRENSTRHYGLEPENSYKSLRFADNQRNTPPRAQELKQIQDVRLVNPKALIPINSERPLPNPYQNPASSKPKVSPKPQIANHESVNSLPKPNTNTQFDFSEADSKSSRPILDETYGIVFDNVERRSRAPPQNFSERAIQRPPRSPSLEATKLRLPSNRDLGPMSPRMRSPIPQHHVSAEKLIATELLRGSRSPTPTKKKTNQLSSSHQRLEMGIDYPDNVSTLRNENARGNQVITSKPPISRIPERNHQLSPNYENRSQLATFAESQERLPGSRPSEYINIQRNNQLSPNYEKRNQLSTFVGSQERLPVSRVPEQLQRNSQLSPNYQIRSQFAGSQEKIPLKTPEQLQRNSQLSPNYEIRSQFVGSQEKIPLKTPEQFQRNSQISPNYDTRHQLTTYAAGSQEKIPLRTSEHLNVQRNGQLSPNYDYRTQLVSSQEMLSRSRTPDQISMQRNSQLSPTYDTRNRVGSQEKLLNATVRSPTPNNFLQNPELSSIRPQSSRSSTPVDLRMSPSAKQQSPQKEEIRRSVEAYYWKEIKKLKEQENMDLYYYQMQMLPFGFAEDPISFRRSRSSSPSQRNGRRSLSLPREHKSQIPTAEVDAYGRFQPTPIPEGRAVVNYSNYYQQNFRRNVPERRTIDAIPRNDNSSIYRPIFKRGSLTTPVRELVEDQQYKKVSFGNAQDEDVWPTRNGYTQNPPQRKVEVQRQESVDDDVFLPNPQQTSRLIVDGKEIYGYTNRPYDNQVVRQQDPPYYQNANFYRKIHQEPVYSSRVTPVRENVQIEDPNRIPPHLTRYNSIQLVDPTYGQHQRVSRRMSFDNSQTYIPKPQVQQNVPRRQIYVKDDVYGYFGGYVPNDQQNIVYSSRQSVAEPVYGYTRGAPRQITVKDKVCDMYGQIHDRSSPSLNVKKSGVMLGQLQPVQNSYSQLPNQNFVRNSRLTASANDMYRRYQNVNPRYPNNVIYDRYPPPKPQRDVAPSRPLPPVPSDKKVYLRQNKDNTSELSDGSKTNSVGKNKRRGIFGNIVQPSLPEENDEKNPSTSDLPRLILLEQLQLTRRQKDLEISKRQWQFRQNRPKREEYRRLQLETRSTEDLCLSDLRKLVLIEELQLIKLKIRLELDDME